MNKLIILILLIGLGTLAIMFNWFGSREWLDEKMGEAQGVVEKVQQTGDELKESLDVLKNIKEGTN